MEGSVLMYSTPLKAGLVDGLRRTFHAPDYPQAKLRNLRIGIEYPVDSQEYPGIWVNFEEALLQTAGIDHKEIDEDGNVVLRWRFEGHASYTIVAMSSLERDLIYDELVRIIAFSRSSEPINAYRAYIESNDLIAMNFDWDRIEPQGENAAPGTPWDTDEVIYEKTLGMQVMGEFAVSVDTGLLVLLSRIVIDGRQVPSTEEDPDNPLRWEIDGTPIAPAPGTFDPGSWH